MAGNIQGYTALQKIKYFQTIINKLAFGQTRFPAAADPIEHISEENFLLQIFAKMETFFWSNFRGPGDSAIYQERVSWAPNASRVAERGGGGGGGGGASTTTLIH